MHTLFKASPAAAGQGALGSGGPQGRKVALTAASVLALVLAVAGGALSGLFLVYSVELPNIADLERPRQNTTAELYDVHGRLFGSIPLEQQVVMPYAAFPPVLREAVFSIGENAAGGGWSHGAFRLLTAAFGDLRARSQSRNASALSVQLARMLLPAPQRSVHRQMEETWLALAIERRFTPQQIFATYANQVALGEGIYGFEAGARRYFGKSASELTLDEAALLAGLPEDPVAYSPTRNPDRAFRRRNAVINAMLENGAITATEANAAKETPLGVHAQPVSQGPAPWCVEEIRRELEGRLGTRSAALHGGGLRVYTTMDIELQQAAERAVLNGLAAYERRRGWRGAPLNVLAAGQPLDAFHHPDWSEPAQPGAYFHAVVVAVLPDRVTARIGSLRVALTPEDWAWTGQKDATAFLKPGDIIYIRLGAGPITDPVLSGTLEQDSGAQGALLAVDNASGGVLAMIGGRDFSLSSFNRATEAERRTGSSFLPYIYTAAVEAGARPQDRILDAPVTFQTATGAYAPPPPEAGYGGWMTLLQAFAEARKAPAARLAERVGLARVMDTAHRFGITSFLPATLPAALGGAQASLEQQTFGYSSFADDGVRFAPHWIARIAEADGLVLAADAPQPQQSTSVQTARSMVAFFAAAARNNAAVGAASVSGPLGGVAGTTADATDAWFLGFSPSVTCGVWMGYDDRRTLGAGETGESAALPVWSEFMQVVVAGRVGERFPGAAQ